MVRRRGSDAGGIATLVDTIGKHWRAVQRDLLALGYRETDIGDTLNLGELVAVVCASPPGTSVRYALDEGWSREAHLLANLTERDSGLINLPGRYPRPGVEAPAPKPDTSGHLESLTVIEFEKRRQAKRRRAQQKGVTPVV